MVAKPEFEIMKNLYTKMWVSLVALTVVMGLLLAFRAGRNDAVLAGMGVPRNLYGGIGPYLPLSHKKRS
jgi:hypothetical protein